MARTTTDLLNSIKRRAQLPDDGGTLSDSDILAFATDEIQNVIYPRLMAMNEWHYAYSYNVTLSSSREYRVNPRTAGNRIISVEYTSDSSTYRFIPYVHPLTQAKYQSIPRNYECYSIFGNKIVLSDTAPTSGTLRVRAVARPSKLVTSGCSAITGVTVATKTITVDVDNFSDNDVVDVVYNSSPYEFVDIENSIDSSVGTTYGLDNAITTEYNGARLCPQEQTDRVQLPDELHDYLAQKVAIRCMEARGFTQDMNNHLRKLVDLETAFDRLVSPRNKGEFKAIVAEDYYYVGRP